MKRKNRTWPRCSIPYVWASFHLRSLDGIVSVACEDNMKGYDTDCADKCTLLKMTGNIRGYSSQRGRIASRTCPICRQLFRCCLHKCTLIMWKLKMQRQQSHCLRRNVCFYLIHRPGFWMLFLSKKEIIVMFVSAPCRCSFPHPSPTAATLRIKARFAYRLTRWRYERSRFQM